MNPAERLRVATDVAQAQWAKRCPKAAEAIARDVALIDEPHQAIRTLRGRLAARTQEAHQLGAQQVAAAGDAAGVPGITIRTTTDDAVIPDTLAESIRAAWHQANLHDDPLGFRRTRVDAITDHALSTAHDAGTGQAITRHPQVTGYRRVTRGGACPACFALITGRIEHDPEAFPRHPRCRCFMEPVIRGVNDHHAGRPTRDQQWAAMTPQQQDNLFTGTPATRAAKADLVRGGHVTLDDTVQYQPRRPGQRPLPEETTLTHLQLIATRGHVTRTGLVHPDHLALPANLTPAEAATQLRARLQAAAKASWELDDEHRSWALDAAFNRAVTMPNRAFSKALARHPEVVGPGLRPAVLSTVQAPIATSLDRVDPVARTVYVADDARATPTSKYLVVVVEFDGILGRAFTVWGARRIAGWMTK